MIYIDTSALVKVYIQETGTRQVKNLLQSAPLVGSALITKTEASAALAKAVRLNYITTPDAQKAWEKFQSDWAFLFRIGLTENLIDWAARLAWDYGLRSYDAIHLAAALSWQQTVGEPVTLATFDKQLWETAPRTGLSIWPQEW